MTTRPFPRTPNLALRRARQSMRLSQAQFAEAIRAAGRAMGIPNNCTKRLVQKWETGEHAACRPDYLRVLQAVTGLSARELGFRVLADNSGATIGGSNDGVNGAGEASPGTGGQAHGLTSAFSRSGLAAYTEDGSIDASMDRLRCAVDHPSTVDARTADFVQTATSRLFDLEHHSPARLLAPTVDRHLATVTALLVSARHEGVRRSLMLSAGYTALLAGWLAFDRGDTPSANRLWDSAISAAEGTVDPSLLSWSLTFHSYAAARRGDPASAWQLARTATTHAPADDPRGKAWATARSAFYAAQLGEHNAAETALHRSLEFGAELSGLILDREPGPRVRFFDHARLLSATAHTSARLGLPSARDYAAKAVDALGPAKVKSRAIVLAEATLTAAHSGELELCLDWGSPAATLTREMEVSTAADLLHEVTTYLLPYSDTRPVRELLPQLTKLKRTADLEDDIHEHSHTPTNTAEPLNTGQAEAA